MDELSDLNRKALRRFVMLLLALADLAERASVRCAFVRWSVLWLLLPGEVIARNHVAALTRDPRLDDHAVETSACTARNGAADAMRLAARFRTLAAYLVAFLEALVAQMLEIVCPRPADHDRCFGDRLAMPRARLAIIERRDSS